MTSDISDEWVEKAAKLLYDSEPNDENWTTLPDAWKRPYRNVAGRMVSAVAGDIRAQGLEDAAEYVVQAIHDVRELHWSDRLLASDAVRRALRARAKEVAR